MATAVMSKVKQVCMGCPEPKSDGRPFSHGWCRFHGLQQMKVQGCAIPLELELLARYERRLADPDCPAEVRAFIFGFEEAA